MSDSEIIAKESQNVVDEIEEEIRQLERRIEILRRSIDELLAGESPIQPNDIITWEGGGKQPRIYRGLVVGVRSRWRGFEYRCKLLTNDGRVIGFANVDSDRFPTLITPKPL